MCVVGRQGRERKGEEGRGMAKKEEVKSYGEVEKQPRKSVTHSKGDSKKKTENWILFENFRPRK